MKQNDDGTVLLNAAEAEALRKLTAGTTGEDRIASGLTPEQADLCGEIYGELTDALEWREDQRELAAMRAAGLIDQAGALL